MQNEQYPSQRASGPTLNIIWLSWDFPTNIRLPIVSGMIKNPWTLALKIKSLGHLVSVITTSRDTNRYLEGFLGDSPSVKFIRNPSRSAGVVRNLIRMLAISRAVKHSKVDVMHAHMPSLFPAFSSKSIARLHVITAHGSHWPEMRSNIRLDGVKNALVLLNGYIQFLIEKWVYSKADYVISVSEYQVTEMLNLYSLPPSRVIFIPNGIDRDRYCSVNSSLDESSQIFTDILFVGRPVPKKGLEFLKRVLARPGFEEVSVTFVFGKGWVSEPDVSGLIEKERFNVFEDVPEEELPKFYRGSRMTVVPSFGYESVPTVILESLFSGTPVLATRAFGNTELLPEMMMADEGDEELWAEKIAKILDLGKAGAMGELDPKKLDRYSSTSVAAQHINLYLNSLTE